VTFLLSDVEGSTRLWDLYPADMRSAQARHDDLIERAANDYDGIVVRPRGEGDSRFAVFSHASNAVLAALRMQLGLQREVWPFPESLRVRIALNSGDGYTRAGDYYGGAINVCARLRTAAHGGQILLTGTTAKLARERLPQGVTLRDLGTHGLKDLTTPESVFQLVHTDLMQDFPALRIEGLSESVGFRSTAPIRPYFGNFIVGRQTELAEIRRQLVGGNVRLLTLTGPGGIGKTHLAIAAAYALEADFVDGFAFVDLSAVQNPTNVIPAVAHALGVVEMGARAAKDSLSAFLADRNTLLVLDNLEQVLDSGADLASILTASPGVRILATSREPLRVRSEYQLRLSPLAVPGLGARAEIDQLRANASVALYVERARSTLSDFEPRDELVRSIGELCARLDGLPLAIELAAAQANVFSASALVARLDDRLDVLQPAPRDTPARHQNLRSTIGWSHDLLSLEEQIVFRRLAVFESGCTLEAAVAVCGGGAGPNHVVPMLAALVNKSLLTQRAQANDEPYFSMLETIRRFAVERLDASTEATDIRSRHARHYLVLAERAHAELRGANQAWWLGVLEREHDNFRAALRLAEATNDAEPGHRLVAALGPFWARRGFVGEARRWFDAILGLDGRSVTPAARVVALEQACYIASLQGDAAAADTWMAEALRLAALSGSPALQAWSIHRAGINSLWRDRQSAETLLIEALALFRSVGEMHGESYALTGLGYLAQARNQLRHAREFHSEALALKRDLGDARDEAISLMCLAVVDYMDGNLTTAEESARQAVKLAWTLGDSWVVSRCLLVCAGLSGARGHVEDMAWLTCIADMLRETVGAQLLGVERAARADQERRVVAGLGKDQARLIERAVHAMTIGEAVHYALRVVEPRPSMPIRHEPVPLSLREREVLAWVARGMSRPEIAEMLDITLSTVDTYIDRIGRKLQVSSEDVDASWASERAPDYAVFSS
jgi:predicted ATPase/class 3 adenylate cyclase/DNA-binding CsgD family transcriptional regulator